MPVDDIYPHFQRENCACNPKIEILANGTKLITHNSYDGREILEEIEEVKETHYMM